MLRFQISNSICILNKANYLNFLSLSLKVITLRISKIDKLSQESNINVYSYFFHILNKDRCVKQTSKKTK